MRTHTQHATTTTTTKTLQLTVASTQPDPGHIKTKMRTAVFNGIFSFSKVYMQCELRPTLWKGGGQGSCSFNSCGEEGISAGLIGIYGEPGEIPSSSQHLKLQELY